LSYMLLNTCLSLAGKSDKLLFNKVVLKTTSKIGSHSKPRRQVMKSRISLLFAGALFCAAVSTTSQAQDTIRLGLQAVPTDVLYQAKDWGQAYDLKTEISTYSSAGDSLKAFLAGRVDVVSGG